MKRLRRELKVDVTNYELQKLRTQLLMLLIPSNNLSEEAEDASAHLDLATMQGCCGRSQE